MTILNIFVLVSLVGLMLVVNQAGMVNITTGPKLAPPPKSAPPSKPAPPPKTPTKPTTPYKCVGPIRQTTSDGQARVAGSDLVNISHYSFMVEFRTLLPAAYVALTNQSSFITNFLGVLVTPDCVLTPAAGVDVWQNTWGWMPHPYNVTLVVTAGIDKRKTTTWYTVEKAVVHPGYVSGSKLLENNLVLLKLDRPISLPGVAPVCLSTVPEKDLLGQNATFIGKGLRNSSDDDSGYQWKVVGETIVSSNRCQRSYSKYKSFHVTGDKICAHSGRNETSVDCMNEGGALVVKNEGWYTLIGIKIGVCLPSALAPKVFSWVSAKEVKWIQKVTGGQWGRG